MKRYTARGGRTAAPECAGERAPRTRPTTQTHAHTRTHAHAHTLAHLRCVVITGGPRHGGRMPRARRRRSCPHSRAPRASRDAPSHTHTCTRARTSRPRARPPAASSRLRTKHMHTHTHANPEEVCPPELDLTCARVSLPQEDGHFCHSGFVDYPARVGAGQAVPGAREDAYAACAMRQLQLALAAFPCADRKTFTCEDCEGAYKVAHGDDGTHTRPFPAPTRAHAHAYPLARVRIRTPPDGHAWRRWTCA